MHKTLILAFVWPKSSLAEMSLSDACGGDCAGPENMIPTGLDAPEDEMVTCECSMCGPVMPGGPNERRCTIRFWQPVMSRMTGQHLFCIDCQEHPSNQNIVRQAKIRRALESRREFNKRRSSSREHKERSKSRDGRTPDSSGSLSQTRKA